MKFLGYKVLLEHGTIISERDRHRAFQAAIKNGHLEVVEALIKSGKTSVLYRIEAIKIAVDANDLPIAYFLYKNHRNIKLNDNTKKIIQDYEYKEKAASLIKGLRLVLEERGTVNSEQG